MRLAIFFFLLGASLLVNGDHLHEVSILTGSDGMAAFFGQLSVKVFKNNRNTFNFWILKLKEYRKH